MLAHGFISSRDSGISSQRNPTVLKSYQVRNLRSVSEGLQFAKDINLLPRLSTILQEDLGSLLWLTAPVRAVAFLQENQGGPKQLVHHESLRQKTCYPR